MYQPKLSIFFSCCLVEESFPNSFFSRFCCYLWYGPKWSHEFWLKFYDSSVGRKEMWKASAEKETTQFREKISKVAGFKPVSDGGCSHNAVRSSDFSRVTWRNFSRGFLMNRN